MSQGQILKLKIFSPPQVVLVRVFWCHRVLFRMLFLHAIHPQLGVYDLYICRLHPLSCSRFSVLTYNVTVVAASGGVSFIHVLRIYLIWFTKLTNLWP